MRSKKAEIAAAKQAEIKAQEALTKGQAKQAKEDKKAKKNVHRMVQILLKTFLSIPSEKELRIVAILRQQWPHSYDRPRLNFWRV